MLHLPRQFVVCTLYSALAVLTLGMGGGAYASPPKEAIADIVGCTDASIIGRARLVERRSDQGVKLVDVTMGVRGLTDGMHAVHVHETGVCTPCSAANGHFDPGPNANSSPDGNHPFHMGDLVNLRALAGRGGMSTTTNRITLSPGPLSVFDNDGSTIIVHVNPDTFCPSGAVAGCAGGARVACGIIRPR